MSARVRALGVPELLFGLGLAATATVILVWGAELSFALDEWDFLLGRLGSDPEVLLRPHFEHISVAPVAIYKLLLSLFGMDSPRPFQLVSLSAVLASLVLVFVYLRRRVGPWLALAGVLPLLFFGPSWDNVLWPFQIGFMGSMAAGLAALLALDRADRAGDLAACVLLCVATMFSSLWVPFAVGAAVAVLSGADRRRRAYVFLVPLFLYGLWWLGWGRDADSVVSFDNLATIPEYVLDGLASSLSSLLGIDTRDGAEIALGAGRFLVVGLGVAIALRLRRLGRVSRGVWITGAVTISYWTVAAVNANVFRHPTTHRYQLIGAIFLLLLASEVWKGVRPRRAVIVLLFVLAGGAAASNLTTLHERWEVFRDFGQAERGELAGVEIARDRVDPGFEFTEQVAGAAIYGNAGLYLSAVDAYGSPAYPAQQLASAPEVARVAADRTLAAALGLDFESVAGRPRRCLQMPAGANGARVLTVPVGGLALELGPGGGRARLRRYASEEFPVELGAVPGGVSRLVIPPDRSAVPWELALVADGPVSVCRL